MRKYTITTGLLFALITLAHLWRVTVEPHLLRDGVYWALTVLAAALSVWAAVLVRRGRA